jgi:hypothetical protein
LLLTLCQVRSHDGRRTQKPKQTELGEATEKEARHGGERIKPLPGGEVVDMPVVTERDPNIDVREKK